MYYGFIDLGKGNNGVGKTSLINVASFELYREYLVSGTGPFFVPCDFRPDKPEYAHKTEYINPELPQAGEGWYNLAIGGAIPPKPVFMPD